MKNQPVFADRDHVDPMNVTGEKLFFLLDHAQTDSYEIYLHDGAEGCGPPMHQHPWDEAFYVIQGEVEFEAAEVKRTVRAGGLVHSPGGVVHSFRYTTPVQILSVSMTDGAKKLFDKISKIIPGKMDTVGADTMAELKAATAGMASVKE